MKLAKLNTKLFKVHLKDENYELVTYKQLSLWITRDQKATVVKAIRQCASGISIDNNNVCYVQWGAF